MSFIHQQQVSDIVLVLKYLYAFLNTVQYIYYWPTINVQNRKLKSGLASYFIKYNFFPFFYRHRTWNKTSFQQFRGVMLNGLMEMSRMRYSGESVNTKSLVTQPYILLLPLAPLLSWGVVYIDTNFITYCNIEIEYISYF